MATYTYKDFEKALVESGMGDQFSQADLKLAQKNPDAGMSILKYKLDYRDAPTDEMRALANEGANQIRASYGEYTGGGDGGSFALTPMSPGQFEYGEAEPTYKNSYGGKADSLMTEILDREDFSYDPASDPLYSSYKKTYTREGKRATADALGEAAAASGGIPSSYAVSAAAQAGNYHAAQLADKVPELYQIAYDKYLNEYQMKQNDLDMVQNREQFEYNRYQDDLNRYQTNRNFEYGKYLDEIDSQAGERSEALEKAILASEYGDDSLLRELGITPDYEALAARSAVSAPSAATREELQALDAAPTIEDKVLAAMAEKYPTGVVTNEQDWIMMKNAYGEEALAAAGYRDGTEATGETVEKTVEADRSDMDDMYDSLNYMLEAWRSGQVEDLSSMADVMEIMLQRYPQYEKEIRAYSQEYLRKNMVMR